MDYSTTENIAFLTSAFIKQARIGAGLTQKELGIRMGISESAVNKLENGQSSASIATLQKVGRAIGKKLKLDFE